MLEVTLREFSRKINFTNKGSELNIINAGRDCQTGRNFDVKSSMVVMPSLQLFQYLPNVFDDV